MEFFRDSFSLGRKASSSSSSVFDLFTIKWEIWSFKVCNDCTAVGKERESDEQWNYARGVAGIISKGQGAVAVFFIHRTTLAWAAMVQAFLALLLPICLNPDLEGPLEKQQEKEVHLHSCLGFSADRATKVCNTVVAFEMSSLDWELEWQLVGGISFRSKPQSTSLCFM